MDTKTLVVGQDVYMVSGCYGCTGKVVKVASSSVDVYVSTAPEAVARWSWLTREWRSKSPDEIWGFDANGKACDSRGTGMFEPGPWEHNGIPGTYECGPWELDYPPESEVALRRDKEHILSTLDEPRPSMFSEEQWADRRRAIEERIKEIDALLNKDRRPT